MRRMPRTIGIIKNHRSRYHGKNEKNIRKLDSTINSWPPLGV